MPPDWEAASIRHPVGANCWAAPTWPESRTGLTSGASRLHRKGVLRPARHLVVLVLTLLVAVGNAAVCAGWQGSAEARMACCTGPGGCPMHAHGSDDQTGSTPSALSQAQADGCCASSESDDAPQTSQGIAWSWTPALVVPFVLADPGLDVRQQPVRAQISRPPPARAVPRHLLLAVFLL